MRRAQYERNKAKAGAVEVWAHCARPRCPRCGMCRVIIINSGLVEILSEPDARGVMVPIGYADRVRYRCETCSGRFTRYEGERWRAAAPRHGER